MRTSPFIASDLRRSVSSLFVSSKGYFSILLLNTQQANGSQLNDVIWSSPPTTNRELAAGLPKPVYTGGGGGELSQYTVIVDIHFKTFTVWFILFISRDCIYARNMTVWGVPRVLTLQVCKLASLDVEQCLWRANVQRTSLLVQLAKCLTAPKS